MTHKTYLCLERRSYDMIGRLSRGVWRHHSEYTELNLFFNYTKRPGHKVPPLLIKNILRRIYHANLKKDALLNNQLSQKNL